MSYQNFVKSAPCVKLFVLIYFPYLKVPYILIYTDYRKKTNGKSILYGKL